MPYASLAELKAWVGIADSLDDATLTLALDAASAHIDNYCDRTFAAGAASARLYSPAETGRLEVDPISTTAGLVVATDENGDGTYETVWAASDYRLEPTNAAAAGEPWHRLIPVAARRFTVSSLRPTVSVTAAWGWPGGTTPAPVKLATLHEAARLWKRKDAPFGVAGSAEFGSEVRLLSKLDPDAEKLLKPYRRRWWVVT